MRGDGLRSRVLVVAAAMGGLGLLGVGTAAMRGVVGWDPEQTRLAELLLVLLASYLALVAWRVMARSFDPFEPPIVLGAFFLVTFGLTSLPLLDPAAGVNSEAPGLDLMWVNKALALYLLAWGALWLGYQARVGDWGGRALASAASARPRAPIRRFLACATLIASLGLLAKLTMVGLGVYGAMKAQNWAAYDEAIPWLQLLHYAEQIGRYALVPVAMAAWLYRQRLATVVLAVLVGLELAFALVASYRTPMIQVVFVLGVVRFYVRRRIPLREFAIAIAVLVATDAFLGVYRTALYVVTPGEGESPIADALGETHQTWSSRGLLGMVGLAGESLGRRAAYLPEMARAVEYRDGIGPLEDPWEFALRPFAALVPRAVWPDKPIDDLSQVFNVEVAGSTAQTASTPLLPGWLYLEFSVAGLLAHFVVLGVVYRAVHAFSRSHRDPSLLLLVPAILWSVTWDAALTGPFAWLHPLLYQVAALLVVRSWLFRVARPQPGSEMLDEVRVGPSAEVERA